MCIEQMERRGKWQFSKNLKWEVDQRLKAATIISDSREWHTPHHMLNIDYQKPYEYSRNKIVKLCSPIVFKSGKVHIFFSRLCLNRS